MQLTVAEVVVLHRDTIDVLSDKLRQQDVPDLVSVQSNLSMSVAAALAVLLQTRC